MHLPRAKPGSLFSYLFRNSQLSTLYNAVKSRTEMTVVTTVRYQGNAFRANRVQCLTLLVHTSTVNTTASAKFSNKRLKTQTIKKTENCEHTNLYKTLAVLLLSSQLNPIQQHRPAVYRDNDRPNRKKLKIAKQYQIVQRKMQA